MRAALFSVVTAALVCVALAALPATETDFYFHVSDRARESVFLKCFFPKFSCG
jgi:hypothetical protein